MKKIIFLTLLCMPFALPAQKTGAKKTATVNKGSGPEASIIAMTVEHNGQKTEISNRQFETWGGSSISAGAGKAIILNYGASNSKKNNDAFSWMFTIPKAEKGTYTVGEKAAEGPATSLTFSTSAFPNIPMFMCKSGSIDISSCPAAGGFITGYFHVILTGGVTGDGQLDESEYLFSGSFSILRQ